MDLRVPVMRPRFPDVSELVPRFQAVRESGIFSNFGPQVRELEHRLAKFLGTPDNRVVIVSNATSGLTAAIDQLGGRSWCAPSWTFSATIAAALQSGVDLTLGDIDPSTQWLAVDDPTSFEGDIVVAPFGSGFGEALLHGPGKRVIDAAASIAADLPDFSKMPETTIVVFSLHATKVLGMGEGGVLICGSSEIAEQLRHRVNFGFGQDRVSVVRGFNAKMSEFQAAIGHLVLDHWEDERAEWLEARARTVATQESLGLTHLFSGPGTITPYWLIECESRAVRNSIEQACSDEGIQTRRWWGNGCHAMPAYSHLPRTSLAHTESIATRYLGLPFYRGIEEATLQQVSLAIERALS